MYITSPRTGVRPTVLVVEDEWLVARHVQACLQSAGFDVPSPVHSARAAVDMASRCNPDVIVMDVKLDGDMDGIAAARAIGRLRRTPIVYLTALTDRDTVTRAAEGHASSYILKPFVERQLVSAVLLAAHQRAAADAAAGDPATTEQWRALTLLLNRSGAPSPPAPFAVPSPACRLSPRERELVQMLAEGARLAGVARRLGLSRHTVRNHLKSIFRKLDIHSQDELVEFWRAQPRLPCEN